MCPKCNEDSQDSSIMANSFRERKKDADSLSLSGVPRSSLTSADGVICMASGPPFVYHRRKLDICFPALCSEGSITDQILHDCHVPDCELVGNEVSIAPPLVLDIKKHLHVSDSKLPNQTLILRQHGAEESSAVIMHKVIDVHSVNDSCSSKSTTELMSATVKGDVDESGECSSSSVAVIEVTDVVPMSERDFCISNLRSAGLLHRSKCIQTCISKDKVDLENGGSVVRSCKACGSQGIVTKMLVCDYCEEVFHLSCCNPRMKKVPEGDWYCSTCLEKKNLVRKQSASKQPARITTEIGRGRNVAASDDLHPITLMLEDDGTYMTDVRVGKGFQADVPEWTGPVNVSFQHSDADVIEPSLEMDSTGVFSFDNSTPRKPLKLSNLGNWLQCRQVIDYADGETICGKWRRAPLFEVQTDKWECFCSVFWDHSHADCAVPQELETEQVLKQLKYIEMLMPRLTAKRQKTLLKNDNGGGLSGHGDIT
ncbi:hypothetical protein MLD38_005938 [Melastoma candidum]|uniref:Uncharacterized protein n=1 Tax=Melastoma candidum TaxID=119954 RepID=A0ACB9RUQ7_9MYRT|nr:hypothetical protein MLD38_005938 [Melastoma candidum]